MLGLPVCDEKTRSELLGMRSEVVIAEAQSYHYFSVIAFKLHMFSQCNSIQKVDGVLSGLLLSRFVSVSPGVRITANVEYVYHFALRLLLPTICYS
jgi:hypothetical protein